MTRDDAIYYLKDEFSTLETKIGLLPSDTQQGYGPIIDNALRVLGVAQADLSDVMADHEDVPEFQALLDYFVLRRYWRLLATRHDSSLDGIALKSSQLFHQVERLFKDAESKVFVLGLIGDPGSFQLGSINLDFLEPSQGW